MASADISMPAEQGTPEQLPQGAATALNAVAPATSISSPELQPAPVGGDFPDSSAGAMPDFAPKTGDPAEDILFADPEGAGTGPSFDGRLPESVVRQLQLMRAAVEEPGAPPALRAIYAAAVNSLDAELR